MNVAGFCRLYEYTDWANDRILAAIATLSEEQFTHDIVSSFPSIRDTIAHIAFAEWIWLNRWKGQSPPGPPEWLTTPSFATVRDRMHEIAAERRAYLDGLTDAVLDSILHYRSTEGDPFSMPLREVLFHCANHSTHHRGQLVTMLRQVGATPPPTMDYTPFVRSRRSEA